MDRVVAGLGFILGFYSWVFWGGLRVAPLCFGRGSRGWIWCIWEWFGMSLLLRPVGLVVAVALMSVATAGCRKEEANRPSGFTPGVYKGETSRALTAQEIRALELRGQLQK
jgi:hypothetical protein